MKTRIWAAVLIFISSYSPLAIIIFIKDFRTDSFTLVHPYASLGILLLAFTSVGLLYLSMLSIRQGDPVKVVRVSNQSGELVNYAIPYMITFFEFDLGDIRSVAAFGVFMLLMFWLTVRTQNIFINPILSLRGYGLYDVEYEENGKEKQATFLAKDEFWRGDTCLIRGVSRFLFVVTRVNPTV
jgi:hypothetical protein